MAEDRRQSDHNKQVMHRFYDEVVNAGSLDVIDELLAADFVEHEELPGFSPDRNGVKQFFGMLHSAFPGLTMTADRMLAEGDLVAAYVTCRGTHDGEFMGIAATGKSVEFHAFDLVQFADGVGTAHWGVTDMVALLTQLGAMPEPG